MTHAMARAQTVPSYWRQPQPPQPAARSRCAEAAAWTAARFASSDDPGDGQCGASTPLGCLADAATWRPIGTPGTSGAAFLAGSRRGAVTYVVKRIARDPSPATLALYTEPGQEPSPRLYARLRDYIEERFWREVAVTHAVQSLCGASLAASASQAAAVAPTGQESPLVKTSPTGQESPLVKTTPTGQERLLVKTSAGRVPCLVAAFCDADSFYLVTELVHGAVDLLEWINSDAWANADGAQLAAIADQLVAAVAAVHGLGVAHRDIKPQNIIVDPQTMEVRLIDFGEACYALNAATVSRPYDVFGGLPASCSIPDDLPGSPGYASPELVRAHDLAGGRRPVSGDVDDLDLLIPSLASWQQADLWSLGATLVALFTREQLPDAFGIDELPDEDRASLIEVATHRLSADQRLYYNDVLFQLLQIQPDRRRLVLAT